MTTSDSEAGAISVKESMPVMPCQTAEGGGSSGQLARGSTPSTRQRKRKESRRMSVLKFFRCTPEQDAIIQANAANAGIEQSSYMRIQSVGKSKVRKARRIRADWKELRRCMGIVNKAGNVINQLVRMLRLYGWSSELANEALTELRNAARAILSALSKN